MTRFRVTERCLRDDLSLKAEDASRDAGFLAAQHEAIRYFVGKRTGAPGDGENVLNVSPYGHIKSLHVGPARAATIYDSESDVCWLLAFKPTHALGERRDAYAHFEWLDKRDELLPTESDYAALSTVTAASLMDMLRLHGAEMLKQARDTPGREVTTSFVLEDHQEASIAVSIELVIDSNDHAEQGWVAFVLPHDAPMEPTQLLDFVADLVPSYVDEDTIDFAADILGRPIHYNEIAFTWCHYSGS